MIMGGTLNLHGDQKHTWTKLANTATAGSTSIQAGGPVTRLSSHPRISIPGRPSGEPLRPFVATRSRSIKNWTTCTSARSRSTSMSVAKSPC
jgi:hypothetical protein